VYRLGPVGRSYRTHGKHYGLIALITFVNDPLRYVQVTSFSWRPHLEATVADVARGRIVCCELQTTGMAFRRCPQHIIGSEARGEDH
jgi:hypothetical protein